MEILIAVVLIPAGLALFYTLFCKPMAKVLAARDWKQTPCVITDSRVGYSGGKSTNYRVEVDFSYLVAGRKYDSDQYQFDHGYSDGYVLKKAVVDQYQPGLQTVCFVNPDHPDEAILMRHFNPGMLFGLAPLAFKQSQPPTDE